MGAPTRSRGAHIRTDTTEKEPWSISQHVAPMEATTWTLTSEAVAKFQGRTGIYCIIKTNSSRGVTRDPKFQFNSSRELELRDIPHNFVNENIPRVVVNAQWLNEII